MNKTIAIVAGLLLAALLLVGAGYGIASWRYQARIAAATAREQEAQRKIAANNAESDQLRGQNTMLRENIAKMSAEDEAMRAIIDSRGGVIAAEAKNLEKINEDLKNDQAVINAPADRCVRCRRFSAAALAAGQIGKPLTCKDECAGAGS